MRFKNLAITLVLAWSAFADARTLETVVYVTTLSTSYTHTGMKQTLSGLFVRAAGDSQWQCLGRPNNRVYTFDSYLPAGGRILGLATHTGVHQSWDSGKTWKQTSDWRMTEVNNIRFHPTQADKIYATSPYGFYKSIDQGGHWLQYNSGLDSPDATYVSAMVPDYANPGTIYIATEDGIYFSNDDGEHWTRSELAIRHIRTLIQHPTQPDIWMAGTENNGLYRSMDHGRHWIKCDTGILHDTFYTVAYDQAHPDTLYAAGFQTGVYKSVDGGKSWRQHFQGLAILDIHSLAVDPSNPQRIYAGSMGQGLFISTDGGLSWRFDGINQGFIWGVTIKQYER